MQAEGFYTKETESGCIRVCQKLPAENRPGTQSPSSKHHPASISNRFPHLFFRRSYSEDTTAFQGSHSKSSAGSLATYRFQKIGIREIEHFLSVKKAEASDSTARKYYNTALASAFEKAIDWNFLSVNPFRKVAKPKGNETYPLFFSRTEFEHLLSFITDKDFRELCIFALLTGTRLG